MINIVKRVIFDICQNNTTLGLVENAIHHQEMTSVVICYCPSCSFKQDVSNPNYVVHSQCQQCKTFYRTSAKLKVACSQCGVENFLLTAKFHLAKCGQCKARFVPNEVANSQPKVSDDPKFSVGYWIDRLKSVMSSISDDMAIPQAKRVHLIVHAGSLVSAIIAAQPIPFADIFILTPIQVVMVYYISRTLGNGISETSAKEIVTYLVGVVGWGVLAQQAILGAYKTVLPYLGGLTTIPLVYAATVGLGYAAKSVIEAKMKGRHATKEEIKRMSKEASKRAKEETKMDWSFHGLKREFDQLVQDSQSFQHYTAEMKKTDEQLNRRSTIRSEEELQSIVDGRLHAIFERYKAFKGIRIEKDTLRPLVTLTRNQLQQVDAVIGLISHHLADFLHNEHRHDTKNIPGIGDVYFRVADHFVLIERFEVYNRDNPGRASMRDAYESLNNRFVYNEEIRELLEKAVATCTQELNIVSAWMNHYVVNDELIGKFEEALRRGATIKILYGINDRSAGNQRKEGDHRSELTEKIAQKLQYKFRVYGSLFRMQRTNTHMKLLICDDSFYLFGSYNLLSFSGEYTGSTRSEGMEYGVTPSRIQELRKQHFSF